MTSEVKEKTKNKKESIFSKVLTEPKKQDDYVTIEVVSLRDVPLIERYREASKPLYLTRYE